MSVWRILLVDDSPLIRNAMQAALEPFGLELVHAENGAIAVDRARSASWDLIFLDCVMPVKDGPTALREIRAAGNTTPVVLVTSVSTATTVASAIKLGKVSYIAKPFTPEQIRAVAGKMLKLDPAVLRSPPRVLLQYIDPALPERLRRALPGHVAIDTSQSLAQSLELAETGRRDLVLFESRAQVDELSVAANLLRRSLPAAGIFAISDRATPDAPWRPDAALDGMVPRSLDEAVVRGFLYPRFLLPHVVIHGRVAHAAGFRGEPAELPVYLATLSRALIDRGGGLDQSTDLVVDLTRMPDVADAVIRVVTEANRGLRDAGASPSFRITAAMHDAIGEQLAGVVIQRA
jgi:CheY-like chemotaxis protein